MYYVFLLAFYVNSFGILMFIFRYSTYHKYFTKTFPVLVVYGFFVGYLFDFLNFSGSFITVLIIFTIHLIHNYRSQKRSIKFDELTGDEKMRLKMELSAERTMRFHILSSITFLISYAIGFIYVFNSHF